MKASETEVTKILLGLEDAPIRIETTTSKISSAKLHLRSEKGSWSTNDILAHLRACADVWGNSIEAMLEHDMPILPSVHPRERLKETNYSEIDFQQSLKAFTSQRRKLLQTLKKLPFKDWSRGAMIGGRVHTVFTQARRIAKHDSKHCEQIERLLKRSG
jgi:hypothetical protein